MDFCIYCFVDGHRCFWLDFIWCSKTLKYKNWQHGFSISLRRVCGWVVFLFQMKLSVFEKMRIQDIGPKGYFLFWQRILKCIGYFVVPQTFFISIQLKLLFTWFLLHTDILSYGLWEILFAIIEKQSISQEVRKKLCLLQRRSWNY